MNINIRTKSLFRVLTRGAFFMIALVPILLFGQNTITGKVTDSKTGEEVIGATVVIKGTTTGAVTDITGSYSLQASAGDVLEASYLGYKSKSATVGNNVTVIDFSISADATQLDDVVLVGTRSRPRSNMDTPVPVDLIQASDLIATGQNSFDKALQYRVPSFNTVQTPVNDATSLLDPYEIRNMGPSRTLILINGKRKNLSALLYTQTSPGRGETGSDISAIPTDAVKRVEILRDGASAQYGSDAIAGVMNIILKDSDEDGSATFRTGMTGAGDGEMVGFSLNNGSKIGKDKGFLNYTIDLSKTNLANRPGTVDAGTANLKGETLYGPDNRPQSGGEYADFVYTDPDKVANYLYNGKLNGVDISEFTTEQKAAALATYSTDPKFATRLAEIVKSNTDGVAPLNNFLKDNPDANNINGSPETMAAKFLVNGGYDLTETSKLYFNAAYVYKKVNSFANYRTPYWRTESSFPYLADLFPDGTQGEYIGYVPTFEGNLNDYNATVGFTTSKDGWKTDASVTVGGNRQTYIVSNTHNRSKTNKLDVNGNTTQAKNADGSPKTNADGSPVYEQIFNYGSATPLTFNPGGTQFRHTVGNIDISKQVSPTLGIAFGTEFRSETFDVIEGDEASYKGGGGDSFAGNTPANSGSFNRYNFGGYFDVFFDITDNFVLTGTVRSENYSDFGNAFVWKTSTRYKLMGNKLILRASLSTGFRAPTLHQQYTQKAQYSFVPGKGIQVGGLVSNASAQARLVGVPNLKAEKSTNITVGLASELGKFNFTVDYYNIALEDRVILSTEITGTTAGNTGLDAVLKSNNLSDLSFFVNGLDTRTSGLDVVMNYEANDQLRFNLAGNYTIENKREGDVKNPKLIEDAGQSVVNATQEALFFTSRPKTKWILGVTYETGDFEFMLNNTYFGKTTFRQQGMDENLKTEFTPKIVTDLGIQWNATDKVTVALNVNNIFDILPEWSFVGLNAKGDALLQDPLQTLNQKNLISFNQRYSQMTYDGYHFSQLGTLMNLSFNYRF